MMLAGVKVVELGQNLAGPFGTQILGDLGADVIKVERPTGDDARAWGAPVTDDTTTMYQSLNRNKKSVTLNLKADEDMARMMAFAAVSAMAVVLMWQGLDSYRGLFINISIDVNQVKKIFKKIGQDLLPYPVLGEGFIEPFKS